MKTVTCKKSIATKKGLQFIEGKKYEFTIDNNAIKIYFDKINFVTIKQENIFNQYFN